jgi:transcriptional regulator with XRE-family HTH domain
MKHYPTQERIGGRLRHLRQVRGLGLRALATQAGCSPSFLSRVENGSVNPSLSMLHNLVHALDTNISSLFADEPENNHWIGRAGTRPVLSFDPLRQGPGIELERLIPYAAGHLLQANIHIVAAGGTSDGEIQHLGEELGYILEGQLELQIDSETYRIGEGDSFFFNSEKPHGYRNPGPGTTRILWVNTPPTF